jgi:outer membrane protein OmpA-like peptidoglycan-associated protein
MLFRKLKIILYLFSLISSGAYSQDKYIINYGFNEYALSEGGYTILDSIISRIKNSKETYLLELFGYCDSVGSHDYNLALSEKRVELVYEYLTLFKIPDTCIVKKQGLGEVNPKNNNLTEKDRQQNRRVEILVKKMPKKPVQKMVLQQIPKKPPLKLEDLAKNVQVGESMVIENLNFQGGRHYLLPSSEHTLKKLLKIMTDNPGLEIEIQGHICCFPKGIVDGYDFDANENKLSLNRAKAIYDYLVKNGIQASRMIYVGYGANKLLVDPERSEADQTKNRRVEIKVLKK